MNYKQAVEAVRHTWGVDVCLEKGKMFATYDFITVRDDLLYHKARIIDRRTYSVECYDGEFMPMSIEFYEKYQAKIVPAIRAAMVDQE